MGAQNEILQLMLASHTALNEKAAILKNFNDVIGKKYFLNDLASIVEFFKENLVSHFAKENILIECLLKKAGKNSEFAEDLSVFVCEHKGLLNDFEKVNKLYNNIVEGDMEDKNELVNECYRIVRLLVSHAQNEDNVLYPAAEKMLDDNDMFFLNKIMKVTR